MSKEVGKINNITADTFQTLPKYDFYYSLDKGIFQGVSSIPEFGTGEYFDMVGKVEKIKSDFDFETKNFEFNDVLEDKEVVKGRVYSKLTGKIRTKDDNTSDKIKILPSNKVIETVVKGKIGRL
ncbi:MAG: hypothetical protein ACRCXZ_01560 [Patescibacteria group bacterium]